MGEGGGGTSTGAELMLVVKPERNTHYYDDADGASNKETKKESFVRMDRAPHTLKEVLNRDTTWHFVMWCVSPLIEVLHLDEGVL